MTAKTIPYSAKNQPRLVGRNASFKAIEVLVRREWIKVFKEPSRAVGIVIQPLLFWWVIGSGFVPSFQSSHESSLNYQTYFFPGILALVLLFSAIFSMITLIDDRSSGFLQAVLASPCSRASVVLGKVLGAFTIACVQLALFVPLMAFAHISFSSVSWLIFLVFAALGSLSFTSLGFLLAWISPSSSAFHALMSIILIPMWILSGAMFPLENTWMAAFAAFNPSAWLVEGFHFSLLGGSLGLDHVQVMNLVYVSLLKLIIFSALCLGVGVYACQRNR